MNLEKYFGFSAITVVSIATIIGLIGITQCVKRDWEFENECRNKGGVVMPIRSPNTGTYKDACVKSIPAQVISPQVEIIPIERP